MYFVYVLRQLKTNREKAGYSFNESQSKNKKTTTTTKKALFFSQKNYHRY